MGKYRLLSTKAGVSIEFYRVY